jgi:hypothetical protein
VNSLDLVDEDRSNAAPHDAFDGLTPEGAGIWGVAEEDVVGQEVDRHRVIAQALADKRALPGLAWPKEQTGHRLRQLQKTSHHDANQYDILAMNDRPSGTRTLGRFESISRNY